MRTELLKNKKIQQRKNRIRKKIRANSSRPRLSVFRSNMHIYAQIIDDLNGKTLVFASEKDLGDKIKGLKRTEIAGLLGEVLAKKALDVKISTVAFDKGSYMYHGRVKTFAESARKGGLKF